MASKLNGLDKVLQWSDFKEREMQAPAAGQSGTAAQTWANYAYRSVNFKMVPGSKPPVAQLEDTVVVDIVLVANETWKASWLSQLPQTEIDALLEHERLHYKLSALMYRDMFIEIMHLKPKTYTKAADANADINAIFARYTKAIVKAVHDVYDSAKETGHNPTLNAAAQKKWEGIAKTAIDQRKPLISVVSGSGLQVPSQPPSPVAVPIPYPNVATP